MNPDALVCLFASELGWRGLERSDVTLTPDICGTHPVGTVVTCFSTTHLKFFIQINQWELGVFGKYNVSVVPDRYGIRPMDFEACEFYSVDEATNEAKRLFPLFGRSNFRNPQWRRQYLEQHPNAIQGRKKKRRGWKGRLRLS